MHRTSLWHPVLIVLAGLLCLPALALAQDQAATPAPAGAYEVTDLGTLGGTFSVALGVNQAGQVVGSSTTAPGQEPYGPGTHAFLWDDGTMTDLGALGGDFSEAQDINDAGQVVGTSEMADGTRHAFLWEDGEMTDLGTLPGFAGGRAVDMNDAGHVVGFAVDPLPDSLATPTVGSPLERHSWLYRDGELMDLGTLGGTNSSALSINGAGVVVGWSDPASEAMPVADASPVAGEEATPPPSHAFVWAEGMMMDLNDLDSGSEVLLATPFAIGDGGHIVGEAIVRQESHAFLLTPISDGSAQSWMQELEWDAPPVPVRPGHPY